MTQIFNQSQHREKRRELRLKMPPAEVLLWKRLQGRQVGGLKFRRQYGVGAYVVDFYCPELRLAIELDGPSHAGETAARYDATRQRNIEALDVHVLRFSNQQIYHQLEAVVETIQVKASELR